MRTPTATRKPYVGRKKRPKCTICGYTVSLIRKTTEPLPGQSSRNSNPKGTASRGPKRPSPDAESTAHIRPDRSRSTVSSHSCVSPAFLRRHLSTVDTPPPPQLLGPRSRGG